MLWFPLVVAVAYAADETPIPAGSGRVTGVVSMQDGTPVVNAEVKVFGGTSVVYSDAAGAFSIDLPPGAQTFDVTFPKLESFDYPEVMVVEGKSVEVQVTMVSLGKGNTDTVVVYEPETVGGVEEALEERKESASVAEVLGQEQMVKSGDSTAAAALTRATGLTLIDGRFAYVRGMGDRYSTTTLNGSGLPSPEPEKRVIPLDLFPTALVDTMSVQKSFSPEMPAEFGGGVVDVRGRRIPHAPILSVSVSGAYRAGVSFEEGNVGPRGDLDALGFGLQSRELPTELAEAADSGVLKPGSIFDTEGYTQEELAAFGESLPNRWQFDQTQLPMDFGASLTLGRRWELGEVEIGGIAGVVYDNAWDKDDGVRRVYSNGTDGLVLKRETTFVDTQNKVRLGGGVVFGAEWGEDDYAQSTTLLARGSSALAVTWDADDPTSESDTRNFRTGWEEKQLFFQQFGTQVSLGPVVAEGRYAYSTADRAEPDRREWTYNKTEDGYFLAQRSSWSEIRYSELGEATHDGRLDLSLPFKAWGGDSKIAIGGQALDRQRGSATRRFSYLFQDSSDMDLSLPIDEVIVPDNIGKADDTDASYLKFEENTNSTDDYSAGQRLYAGYAMGDVRITDRVRALAGARIEQSTQSVLTQEGFTEEASAEAGLDTLDVLPAATLTFGIGPKDSVDTLQVRASYGRTLSRPELRELSSATYYDYRTGRSVNGNPDLQRAIIDNADVRLEWYPADGESVSVGAFTKLLDSPIETVVAASAVSGSVVTFENAESAFLIGGEVDGRKRLDFLPGAAKWFVISGNLAVINSEVDLSGTDGNQTSDVRPLQGQSPWVVNAQLGWENDTSGTSIGVLYNVFGPRIVEVGANGIPDTWEEPVHRLDLVASQKLGEMLKLRLKATNLLDWPIEQTTGGEISESVQDGWSVGLAVSFAPQLF